MKTFENDLYSAEYVDEKFNIKNVSGQKLIISLSLIKELMSFHNFNSMIDIIIEVSELTDVYNDETKELIQFMKTVIED